MEDKTPHYPKAGMHGKTAILFLKDENTSQNLIRIELKLSYNDMFRRNKKEFGMLLDFQVLREASAPAPCPYKDGFSYYFVRIGFVSALHL